MISTQVKGDDIMVNFFAKIVGRRRISRSARKSANLRMSIFGGWQRRIIYISSFALPFVIVMIDFAVRGAMPFGNASLLAIDAWGQYYPMLCAMKEAIKSGELFWSFKGLLGFNLWAQSAYYTNSILWLPLYLLPDKFMIIGINILAAVRISLAGLTCFIYLSGYRTEKSGEVKVNNMTIGMVMFSTAYSLSAYMLAFINQFMWMDAVICLPLVVKGIDEICSKRGGILYIVAISYTIISNFYIGYMVCLFSVVYFIGYLIGVKMSFRQFWERTWKFFLFSLISGAISALYTLPTYYAIKNTAASGAGFGGGVKFYHSVTDVLGSFLPFCDISLAYEASNIYCGIVCVVLCFLSFIIQKDMRKRICFVLGCAFFYISLNCNIFDYVWHGFHYPNQLPGRWSFCICFLIVKQAYSAYSECRKIYVTEDKEITLKKSPKCHVWKYLSSLRGDYLKKCSVIFTIVMLLLFVEVTANAIYTLACQVRTTDGEAYYQTIEKYKNVAQTVEKSDNSSFYRVELERPWNFNPGQLCGYNGISYYSSTMSKAAYDFFGKAGMSVYAKNVSTRYEKSPAADAFLGVKYRIVDGEKGAYYVKNEAALPICYTIKEESIDIFVELLNNRETDYNTVQNFIHDSVLGKMNIVDKNTDLFTSGRQGMSSTARDCDRAEKNNIHKNEYISGHITTDDGILVISLPYNEGWEIYIDGKRQSTQNIAGYMLAASIEKGEHFIELKHRTKGLSVGIVISVLGLVAALAFAVIADNKED